MLGWLFSVFGRLWGGEKQQAVKSQHEKEQKLADSKSELEQKLKETNQKYEKEIAQLKDKLESASSSKGSSSQVDELNKEWQKKCDSLLNDAHVRHQMALAELEKRSEQLEETVKATEQKHESLRLQAAAMKQRYESRIIELESEQGAAHVNEPAKQQMVTKVKQVMNTVYHELKEHFEVDHTYRGDEINRDIMGTIKRVTILMMQEVEEEANTAEEQSRDTDEECIVAATVSQTSAMAPKRSNDKDQLVANVIKATVASPCGDKGNPYYAEELNKENQDDVKKTIETGTTKQVLADVIHAVVAPTTGDKGSPYYAKELDEAGKDEECIVAATVSQTSAMAPKPSNGKDQLVANVIKAAVASPCGDKGNPYYAEELNRENKDDIKKTTETGTTKQVLADVIQAVVAPTTGDKGNPYYAKELDEAGEIERSEIPIVAASAPQMSTAPSALRTSNKSPDQHQHEVIAEIIRPVVGPYTGDKGNPYYAAELSQSGEVLGDAQSESITADKSLDQHQHEVIAGIIKPVVAPFTGDKGNPYYAAELSQSSEIPDKSHEQPFPSERSESVLPVGQIPSDSDNLKSKDMNQEDMPFVTISRKDGPNVTGGCGNPYRAEEILQHASKEITRTETQEKHTQGKSVKEPDTSKEEEKGKKTISGGEKDKISDAMVEQEKDKKSATALEQAKDKKSATMVEQVKDSKSSATGEQEKSHTTDNHDKEKRDVPSEQHMKEKKGSTSITQEKDKNTGVVQSGNEKTKSSSPTDKSVLSHETGIKDHDSTGVKDSTKTKDAVEVKDSTKAKDSTEIKESTKAKDSTGVKESTKDKGPTSVKDSTKAKTSSEKKKEKLEDFDDDLKPKPPPLFDDDDEDDDLNWMK